LAEKFIVLAKGDRSKLSQRPPFHESKKELLLLGRIKEEGREGGRFSSSGA
jgi:hypothetical protein